MKKEESARNEVVKRIAEARLQALRAQMNPHFIFNSLNSIQQFISDSEKENALRYLSKFARLIRMVLQNSSKPANSVEDELRMLSFYLELEALRFSDRFSYNFEIAKDIATGSTFIPAMLLQPFVENAIVHGLLNKPTKGHLSIEMSRQNGELRCVIEDNGIGREAARAIKNKKSVHHESMGIKVTEERMEMLEHLSGDKARIEVRDLHDEEGKPAGTHVEIYIAIIN